MRLHFALALCSLAAVTCAAPFSAHAQSSYKAIKVTSLDDRGPGTLRDCVLASGARVCLFEISGRIKLSTPLEIKNGDLIVAGQSAPSPGILITNAGVQVKAKNVSLEHLSIRAGDDLDGPAPSSRDSLSVQTSSASNVVLRNLSVSWGVDENFSTYGPVRDVLIENSIFSEALYRSLHPKGPHSMGALVGETARNVSFVGNLFASNHDRNVRWKFDTTGEMINNVIYGWGGTSSWNITNLTDLEGTNKPTMLDVIGNAYYPGPSGNPKPTVVYAQDLSSNTRVYLRDNIAPALSNLPSRNIASSRVGGSLEPQRAASQALSAVLANAGSRPWDRSADDLRVLDGVNRRTLPLRDKVGTWPSYRVVRRPIELASNIIYAEQLRPILRTFEGPNPQTGNPTPVPTTSPTPVPPRNNPAQPTPRIDPPYTPTNPPGSINPKPGAKKPSRRRPWLRSRSAWKKNRRELCCTKRGVRQLRAVRKAYPSIANRCEALTCSLVRTRRTRSRR